MKNHKLKYYSLLLLFLAAAVAGLFLLAKEEPHPSRDLMMEAAKLHERVTEAVKKERLARGFELIPEDHLALGLMGAESTAITTSLGNPEAKRTAQLPDFAALMVKLFQQAGLKAGDRIGASFSASFPGLDLALLCAAKVMGLEVVYSASVGSSNYGANLPGYVLPEMIETAVAAGLLDTRPFSVTLGGDGDRGENMLGYMLEETEEIDAVLTRLSAAGIYVESYDDYETDVKDHMARMGEIKLFVNAGGGILGMGDSDALLSYGQGLLREADPQIGPKSGLVDRYLSQGIPVIHLLNIKQLCAEQGIPYDPVSLPEIGTAPLYFVREYPGWLLIGTILFACLGVAFIEWKNRNRTDGRKSI